MLVQIKLRYTMGKPCEELSIIVDNVGKYRGKLNMDKVYDKVALYLLTNDIHPIWFVITQVGIEPVDGPINFIRYDEEE